MSENPIHCEAIHRHNTTDRSATVTVNPSACTGCVPSEPSSVTLDDDFPLSITRLDFMFPATTIPVNLSTPSGSCWAILGNPSASSGSVRVGIRGVGVAGPVTVHQANSGTEETPVDTVIRGYNRRVPGLQRRFFSKAVRSATGSSAMRRLNLESD